MTPRARIITGDCIEKMRELDEASVDAVVCDGPYALQFMGKEWDSPAKMLSQATGISGGFNRIEPGVHRPDVSKHNPLLFQQWTTAWATEALRVLKPGGHLLAFSSTRTYQRHAVGIEDAGFEIRDMLTWNYLQGMPKTRHTLKPGIEPICVARKPFKGSQRDNIAKYGVGGLFIEACRIGDEERVNQPAGNKPGGVATHMSAKGMPQDAEPTKAVGRHPMNVLLDDGAAVYIDELVGTRKSGTYQSFTGDVYGDAAKPIEVAEIKGSVGGPSRMIFVAKASKADREAGCDDLPKNDAGRANSHNTVKPRTLMAYLARLVTPPGGTVLDPFMGSGSTGVGCMIEGLNFIGIEMEPEYVQIAAARIKHAKEEHHAH